jgi:type IV pilus assembly protein PilV
MAQMKLHAKNFQTGSVLLEALIAILIFSIGILALVGMQATAINAVADAKYRSTAGYLADQIIGTVWANRTSAFIPNASNVMVTTPDPTFNCAPNLCAANNGNSYTLAWASSVAGNLPAGTGSVSVAGNTVTVSVFWQPPKDAVAHRHVVSAFID